MKCEKCGITMAISSWDGWVWFCFGCDTEGREATEEEIKKNEQEYEELKEEEYLERSKKK